MGQEQSAVTVTEAASASVPGRRCYVTSALDDLCDYDRLWDELKAGLRTDYSQDQTVIRIDVKDISENEFELVRKHDGEKLRLGVKEHYVKSRFFLDKERGEVLEEQRNPLISVIEEIRVVRILRSPLRMEMLAQKMHPDHRVGPFVQGTFAAILKAACKRDVLVFPERPCRVLGFNPTPNLQCVESEPLDSHIGFEDLVEAILDTLRSQEYAGIVKPGSVMTKELTKDPLSECFAVFFTTDGPTLVQAGLSRDPADQLWKAQVESAFSPKDPGKATSPEEAKASGTSRSAEEAKDAAPERGDMHCLTVYNSHAETKQMLHMLQLLTYRGPPLIVECWAQWFMAPEAPINELPWEIFKALTQMTLQFWANALVARLSK